MRRQHQRKTADDTFNRKFTVFCLTRWTVVALGADLARILRVEMAHADRESRHVLLARHLNEPMRKAHLNQRTFLSVGRLQRLDVLKQLITIMRLVENRTVDALRLCREIVHDSCLC